MVWQAAAQLPGIYKMASRLAGLRPVSIVTHMIFLCVAFHATFEA
ncbi:putative membrane protein [Escherichia coli 2785200]|nr:putative membrane protein [Escherichia coli 2788150]EMW39779.1 putative membrane protein [Escherichia coli 2785200]ENC40352.1 putative membrane protein [Escherichia coli P02997067.6]